MSLQLLERLTDFEREVIGQHYKETGLMRDPGLPMEIYYDDYIKFHRQDVKSYEYSKLRDYIHFSY